MIRHHQSPTLSCMLNFAIQLFYLLVYCFPCHPGEVSLPSVAFWILCKSITHLCQVSFSHTQRLTPYASNPDACPYFALST